MSGLSSRHAVVTALVAGVATLAVTAFAAAATSLSLSASGSALKFNKTSLSARAGKVTLKLKNNASIRHDVAVKGKGVTTTKGKTVGKGKTSTVTVTLKKGTYTFFCSVPGHEKGGMKGTLRVT